MQGMRRLTGYSSKVINIFLDKLAWPLHPTSRSTENACG